MRNFIKVPTGLLAIALLAPIAGACSNQLAELSNASLLPKVNQLARPDWMSYSGAKDEFVLRPVTAADLVTAEGQCAITADQAAAAQNPDAADQPVSIQGGIALQMTECDVVRRAGAPDQMQVGADERGDRALVLTYTRGSRPGVYRFVAGRLFSIERAPGAEPAAKQPKGKAKKAARG